MKSRIPAIALTLLAACSPAQRHHADTSDAAPPAPHAAVIAPPPPPGGVILTRAQYDSIMAAKRKTRTDSGPR